MRDNETVAPHLKDRVARIWAAAAARAAAFETCRVDASSAGKILDQVGKGEIIPFFARSTRRFARHQRSNS
jgi:hypothetical protein